MSGSGAASAACRRCSACRAWSAPPAIRQDRVVVAIDYPGRGGSGWTRQTGRHAPEACLGDVLDICAALHVQQAVAIGTSFGGLLPMGLAAASPGLVHAPC
jgi:pimeloyl-ACP methyl ester carboxylesterase